VESLPKMEKSITFHQCTVICDVLQPIKLHFLQRQHKLYLIFCVSYFCKVGKFATSIKRPKSQCFSFRGALPPYSPTRALLLDPVGGSTTRPRYRGLTVVFVVIILCRCSALSSSSRNRTLSKCSNEFCKI